MIETAIVAPLQEDATYRLRKTQAALWRQPQKALLWEAECIERAELQPRQKALLWEAECIERADLQPRQKALLWEAECIERAEVGFAQEMLRHGLAPNDRDRKSG
jgi:hypothetical protein